jgi:ATP-dependent Clp protease protease subunit
MADDILSVLIPQNLENVQLPSPELLNYYKDLESRKIWLDYEITNNTLEIVKQILIWNKEDAEKPDDKKIPIRLYVFCVGGENDPSIALINVCELSKTPIYTYNMGVAMSNGLDIFLAGHKRFCLHGSCAMIHSGGVGVSGTSEQVKAATDNYKRQLKYYEDYELRRTGMPKSVFSKHKSKDWYLSADDQVQYGVAHSIVKDVSELL